MEFYQLKRPGRDPECVYLFRTRYVVDGSLAVMMMYEDGEVLADVTKFLEPTASDRLAYVDENDAPWMGEFLQREGLAFPTGRSRESGLCTYRQFRFTHKFFDESYEDEG